MPRHPSPPRIVAFLLLATAIAGRTHAASTAKACRTACTGLIAACTANGAASGFGQLAQGCKKAVMARCRREGASVCGTYCGNGTIDPGERCDGTNLASSTCLGLGFLSGTLACTSACTFDMSGCQPAPRRSCGNGIIDPGEHCDGTNLGGAACTSLGFASGALRCTNACAFDLSVCTRSSAPQCGNGVVDLVEQCDGTNLAGASCTSLGFAFGTLRCTTGCAFDTAVCGPSTVPQCGDGQLDPAEQCDGNDLAGFSCRILGYAGGTLACASGCGFDLSGCVATALPATGQTTAYPALRSVLSSPEPVPDDGTVEAGAPLAFVDNGDGTITDLNTKLMWTKHADDGGYFDVDSRFRWSVFQSGQSTMWSWLEGLNANGGFAGHTDWRLPNIRELSTLVSFGRSDPGVEPVWHTNCTIGCNVTTCSCTGSGFPYWSTTTDAGFPSNAWAIQFSPEPSITTLDKGNPGFVRAVR
jgi:Protein of unknown function (DUF1566)